MKYSELKELAIDYEYFFDDDKNLTPLCVAISDGKKSHAWWLLDEKQKANFIATVEKYKHTGVFIAHAVEAAEGRCFHMLGLDPTEYNWRDTFIESKMIHNNNQLRHTSHSLVAVSNRYLGVKVDVENKTYCRDLIITRKYEGHEQEILDYCKSDVHDLIEIAKISRNKYSKLLRRGVSVHGPRMRDVDKALLNIGKTAAQYAVIGCRGIPLNDKYVNLLLDNAPQCLSGLQKKFNEIHEIYEERKGKLTRKTARVQAKLQQFADERGIAWPKTPKGNLSTTEGVLKEYKGTGTFPDLFRTHGKMCRTISSFCKEGEKNWLHNYNPTKQLIRPSLFPYGTQTGRCAAKPKSGFIYTWGKVFRGLISPPEGYCLIEVDYGSQEVCVSANWSKDQAMLDSYLQNDYYLAFMQKCGRFPADLALPTEEQRELPIYKQYAPIRHLAKGCCLGLSYGMGVSKLAKSMMTDEKTAQEYKTNFEKVNKKYTRARANLKREVENKMGTVLSFPDGFLYEVIPNRGGSDTRSVNSLLNLPIQGLGAVMLRELVNLCFEREIHIMATVHDAAVVMCKVEDRDRVAEEVKQAMLDASTNVLGTLDMKIGAPEFTYHDQPSTHGADAEWQNLLHLLGEAQKDSHKETPDLSEPFDITGDTKCR